MKWTKHIAASTLLLFVNAHAYEQDTHVEFSKGTASPSSFIQDTLGFKLTDIYQYIHGDGVNRPQQTIEQIRYWGSFREDDGSRPLNHFYDPNTNKTGIGLYALGGRPTPDWALEDAQASQDNTWDLETGQPEDVACCLGQNYSLHDAREYLYKALTETDLDVREENRMKHFYSMGHVLHLVADMGQPEHVRLDQHLSFADDPNLLQQIINGFGWQSKYERYSKIHRREIIDHTINRINISGCDNPRIPVTYTRPDFNIATARDLFDDENGNGLAEFTNRNFVSNDTNFDSSRYPSPVASATPTQSVDIRDLYTLCENTPYTGPYRSAPISNITNTELSGSIDFYGSDVTDPSQPGNPVYNDRAASMSIFSKEADEYHEECTNYLYNVDTEALDIRTVNPGCRKYTLNRWNFDRAHEFLVPRIIAYGDELVNHTYRGRMELFRPDPEHLTALRLDESSGDIMQLPVSIANTTPGESMEGGKLIAVVRYMDSQGEVPVAKVTMIR